MWIFKQTERKHCGQKNASIERKCKQHDLLFKLKYKVQFTENVQTVL